MHLTTRDEAATQAVGQALGPVLEPGDVLLLSGDLGAGKTQLTKGIARGLGVADPVTSPTFNLLLVHEGRIPLYHFDLYRLDAAEQLEDLDYFATLEGDGVSVVEWGDRFPEAATADALSVDIGIRGDESRAFTLGASGPRSRRLLEEWLSVAAGIEGVRVSEQGS